MLKLLTLEIKQEEAEQIFFDNYAEKYNILKRDFKFDTLSVSFGEGSFSENGNSPKKRYWTINIYINDQTDPVGAYISADGKIINAVDPFARNLRDEWYDEFMSEDFWTVKGMYNFLKEWQPRVAELERKKGNG